MAPAPDQGGLQPSPFDLTTLQNVKDWLDLDSSNDDDLIQAIITSNGLYWLWRCGLGNQDGTYTQSPLNSVCTFNEVYDGVGGYRQFFRNRPIQSVISLKINNVTIPQSTQYQLPGWVIDASGKSISIRRGGGGTGQAFSFSGYPVVGAGYAFVKGIQNVFLNYTAGYAITPFDVENASKIICAQTYRRRQNIDQKSIAMGNGAGTITFRDWEIPPECSSVMRAYERTAVV